MGSEAHRRQRPSWICRVRDYREVIYWFWLFFLFLCIFQCSMVFHIGFIQVFALVPWTIQHCRACFCLQQLCITSSINQSINQSKVQPGRLRASINQSINQSIQGSVDIWKWINQSIDSSVLWVSEWRLLWSSMVFLCSLKKLREEVRSDDTSIKKKLADDQNTGYGYGGKYGVETDRMDKVSAYLSNFGFRPSVVTLRFWHSVPREYHS